MTTEDDFQNALDAQSNDWHTRLVFADWLEERGDPRAEGYRALGRLSRRALPCRPGGRTRYIFGTVSLLPSTHESRWGDTLLPHDWYTAIELSLDCDDRHNLWKYYPTRREAEDAAARAFAQLPATRRAEILSLPSIAGSDRGSES